MENGILVKVDCKPNDPLDTFYVPSRSLSTFECITNQTEAGTVSLINACIHLQFLNFKTRDYSPYMK